MRLVEGWTRTFAPVSLISDSTPCGVKATLLSHLLLFSRRRAIVVTERFWRGTDCLRRYIDNYEKKKERKAKKKKKPEKKWIEACDNFTELKNYQFAVKTSPSFSRSCIQWSQAPVREELSKQKQTVYCTKAHTLVKTKDRWQFDLEDYCEGIPCKCQQHEEDLWKTEFLWLQLRAAYCTKNQAVERTQSVHNLGLFAPLEISIQSIQVHFSFPWLQ